MTPDGLAAALLPLSSWRAADEPRASDFDLNPGLIPPSEPPSEAAVLVAFTPREQGPTLTLTRRADTLARHTGQIAFPGGRLDPGEGPGEAAIREAMEEIGLPPGAVRLLGTGDRYRTGTGYLVTPVVAWVDTLPRLTASPAEVAEIFHVPWDFLSDPNNRRQDHYDLEGVRRQFWSIDWRERRIWGATAGMIVGLAERLGRAAAGRAA
ncbi:MAG TPA: CoA pyrophosphatase [Brevundimonas sp.]|uniref:NUDIX hydrolase n=1 Tax=Brevundimonas sp. TaxID=1871086 RepID=UPI002DE40DCB|nr:CoA pyrophosphatase [Brevundimonas sp.]